MYVCGQNLSPINLARFNDILPTFDLICVIKLKKIEEPISKMWIRVHGKARSGEKAEHTR